MNSKEQTNILLTTFPVMCQVENHSIEDEVDSDFSCDGIILEDQLSERFRVDRGFKLDMVLVDDGLAVYFNGDEVGLAIGWSSRRT